MPEAAPEGDATPVVPARCAAKHGSRVRGLTLTLVWTPRSVNILPADGIMSQRLKQAMLAVRPSRGCFLTRSSSSHADATQDSFMAMQESSGGRLGFTTKPQS